MRQQRNTTPSRKRSVKSTDAPSHRTSKKRNEQHEAPKRRPTKNRVEIRDTAPRRTAAKRVEPQDEQKVVRLNKAIADAGVASRRRADELIRSGCVRINGRVVTELGTMVEIDDMVTVNGEPITRYKHLTYIVLNKPKDTISTSSDEKGRATVFDIVKIKSRLFTIGRLDRNTTGVLLITNDGDLANKLMHPRYGITRVYKAALDRPLRQDHMRAIAKGVELEDGPTQPVEIAIDPSDKSSVLLAIREGRNREVRRIFEHFGYEVKRLDRKEYANITTRGLKRGEYRHLTRDEVAELQRLVSEA